MKLSDLNPNGHRALQCRDQSHVRFCNASGTYALVIWFNYHGHRVLYTLLNPGQYIDMKTYKTHPWAFETSVGDRLDGNFARTFFPQTSNKRQVVNITYPMYSLKERALQVIRDSLRLDSEDDILQLELPKPLKEELEILKVKKMCADIHTREPAVPAGNQNPTVQPTRHPCTFQSCLQTQFAEHRRY